jgi:cytochrome c oxidase assembly protein subunit 15
VKFIKSIWFDKIVAAKRLRLYVWLSLATQILIVVTGGLVRLTASGLGCPTWPKCTDESIVSAPEMGIHGIIEFGNRLLTIVLLVVALLTFFTIFRTHPAKKRLMGVTLAFFANMVLLVVSFVLMVVQGVQWYLIALWLFILAVTAYTVGTFIYRANKALCRSTLVPAFGLGLGIIAQAVLGGITVLTQLNPWIVGLHFVVSSYLIALASVLVFRALPKQMSAVSGLAYGLRWPIAVVSAVTILIGVLVTGAGPHAGDIDTPRNGLDLEIWQHYHSYPGYLMAGLIGIALIAQWRAAPGLKNYPTRALVLLFAATCIQAIVGVIQARTGVPPFLVALHMLGAAVLSSMVTFYWLTSKKAK